MTNLGKNMFPRPVEIEVPPLNLDRWIIQYKYNGVAAVLYDGNLYSRTGKQFVPRVVSPITERLRAFDMPRYVYGELWNPALSLPEINGRLNHHIIDDTPATDLQFMIYDCYSPDLVYTPYHKRMERVAFANHPITPLVRELKSAAHDPSDTIDGLIFRLRNGVFMFGPSGNLLKLKKWREIDARVLRTHKGDGATNSDVIGSLDCETPTGVRFSVGSGMTFAERTAMLDTPPKVVKVRFVNYSVGGVPLNPVYMETLA